MTTFLIVTSLGIPAGAICGAIVGSIAGWHPVEYLKFQFGTDKSDTWAEGELTGAYPVVARTPGRHREETVNARLAGGGGRLEDTDVISRADIERLLAEEVA